MDESAQVNKFLRCANLLLQHCEGRGTSRMLPKACNIVFCQLTSSPKVSASVVRASSTGTNSSINSASTQMSSAKSKSVYEWSPRHAVHAYPDCSLFACGKRVWRHYTPLSYPRHNFEPRTLETVGVSYKSLISVTNFSGTPALFSNSQSAGRLMESKATRRST